jgi:hypothetical protein
MMSAVGRIKRICLVSAIAWPGIAPAADATWHYTIDQPREKQQANFCATRPSVEELAGIFDRFGPRSGYAALSASPDCTVAVKSFTPRKIVATVTISAGKPGEYRVRFVEVENDHGDVMYLVTTRDVVAE